MCDNTYKFMQMDVVTSCAKGAEDFSLRTAAVPPSQIALSVQCGTWLGVEHSGSRIAHKDICKDLGPAKVLLAKVEEAE